MTFFSLLAALLLEQTRALRNDNALYRAFGRYVLFLEHQLNAGEERHGILAWMLAVIPLVLFTVAIQYSLHSISPILAWLWNIAILYLTMGFRQFSHYFTAINDALRSGDLPRARDYLARWQGESTVDLTAPELARVTIELALVGSHRYVFGPIAWFIVLGPAGAVLYRATALLAEKWGRHRDAEFGDFGMFAQKTFYRLDWLPARLTAASFAVVGNFEDAIYCWRTQARAWARGAHGIILAAGGGAVGVRLGDTLHLGGTLKYRPELGLGDEAHLDFMQSSVGLIWRALVLWMFLILVVTVAHTLG